MQKFGVREICEVVLKAKTAQKIGNKLFYKNEPVMYFDTLKTSSLEGQANTVYAEGGRGNSRLVAWEGERTLTFTMEDALISAEGLHLLTGAGLLDATTSEPVYQHMVENTSDVVAEDDELIIYLDHFPYLPTNKRDNFAYVMIENPINGEMSEPMIPKHGAVTYLGSEDDAKVAELLPVYKTGKDGLTLTCEDATGTEVEFAGKFKIVVKNDDYTIPSQEAKKFYNEEYDDTQNYELTLGEQFYNNDTQLIDHVLVDYYTVRMSGAKQIEITPDKFGGNYYLEASTLFRNTDGMDLPAEFIIPNCKIQSNFTFSMAATGDPSTFTFTMDAFPDYTRFDRTHKVLCAIQVIEAETGANHFRDATNHSDSDDMYFEHHHHF